MPAGRPLKFTTVKGLQAKFDDYFEVTPDIELTITGLALALDTSRQPLLDGKRGHSELRRLSYTRMPELP